jgi:hypothetical protein
MDSKLEVSRKLVRKVIGRDNNLFYSEKKDCYVFMFNNDCDIKTFLNVIGRNNEIYDLIYFLRYPPASVVDSKGENTDHYESDDNLTFWKSCIDPEEEDRDDRMKKAGLQICTVFLDCYFDMNEGERKCPFSTLRFKVLVNERLFELIMKELENEKKR